ncbi:putative 2OG-Fe(II) oxygenase [Phenylobacterium sp.]|uniref:putative 2OG-Fe(II) oxygenase n=1 Tax=Phenylobacterium sp. TaxID=1871053 RepID=UPI002DF2B456|nr:putative 2OG-Fe(II) oxygenase [Phenylobacterium sp.]
MTASPDVLKKADTLVGQGRAAEALALTQPLATAAEPTHAALTSHAVVLKALRRPQEALAFNEQATRRFPASGVAWHNLAATLGDLGRGDAARKAAEEAFRRGLDVSQTWSVYARALLAVGALDEAERAYRECLLRAPGEVEVATEYANVIWMRRGDMAAAQAVLDGAFHGGASPAVLLLVKAKLLEGSGDHPAAARLLAMGVERMPGELPVLLAAAQAAVETGAIAEAERFAAAALALGPDRPEVLNQATIVELAAGRPDKALAAARRGLAIDPGNQSLWGWAATAARAAGDPLYGEVYDYEHMVGAYQLETPQGWASLEAYLAELATVLRRMHPYDQHPFHQSLRHGSQTMQPLTGTTEPVLQAFFQAIDKPIREHMAWLGQGTDPLRRRNTGKYLIDGAWSVSLKPGGFHKDHFHPQGWLSSAFYVETPDQALDAGDKGGWIRFGQPPIKLDPPLQPEHYVRPQPGRLVLFPSYMWHGTEPFTTDERRLTIAFDVIPG